ncbi:chromosome replication initiation and membrane attachment protein [Spiroplasma sp. NBRC 100390]|uniref:DnaD domain protein n=1 Tax=unclassified Spiroplasma TaxID=2637901 RepID=UPI0008928B13|nr:MULTISPECIES: DnaD domain protein [unclassified Spiroplasma]AOX43488.1 chromosome replication initiation and membrane attachment protein [Spiroplasma sp. TU-14]APE12958.1 chromosome replication initiation and membrane attachment protein [Spiroplasma sp. NBRC 100390]
MLEKEATYLIKQESQLSDDERMLLLCLYRPIIGDKAHMLYIAFTAQDFVLELNIKYQLDHLLLLLQMTYEEFLTAKNTLETIGLLKMLKREKGKHHILKPQLPISAIAFFENKILSDYLLNIVGAKCFTIIKDKFIEEEHPKTGDKISPQLNIANVNLDFVYIDKYLATKNANHKLYLPYREKIIQLANYYHVLTNNLAIFIYKSIELIDQKRIFNYEKFQHLLSDFHQKTILKKQITGEQLKLIVNEENIVRPTNMLEAKINEMTSIDPIEYLTLLRENTKPTPMEVDLIRDLIINYSLKPGVVNCLIEYVWFKNSRRIERKYCEKIANTFNQLQIDTVDKAMGHLRSAYAKTQKNKIAKETIKSSTYQFKQSTVKNNMATLEYNKLYEQKRQQRGEEKVDLNQLLDDLKNL